MARRTFVLLILVIGAAAPRALSQTATLAQESLRARDLMAAGQYEAAVPLYRDLVRVLPHNSGLASNLGMALHMAGREKEAVAAFKQALALDPANVAASLYLGDAYLSLGKPELAAAPLESAVRAQPDNPDVRENLGKALLASRRYRSAAAQFEKLSARDPNSAPAWYGLGLSYQALAQRSFGELQKRAPGTGYWLALAAGARAKAMQYSSAFYLYRQALEKTPNLRGAHAALAAIYRKTNHESWARTEEARERKLGPPNCSTAPLDCDYAARHYAAIARSLDAAPAALYWKSRAFNQLAIEAFSHLDALPDSPEYHELLATVHESGGDYAGASAEWRKAHALAPNDPQITQQLALALVQTKNFNEALPLVEELKRLQPDSPGINYLLGDLLLSEQQPAKAIPSLAEAVRRDPNLLRAQSALGRAYMQAGQSAKAIPHLRVALPLDADGSLHYQLARAYAATGQSALAQPLLKAYQRLHQADEEQTQKLKEEVRVTPP
ncbi:MAG: tetratricopeptide repeat protein [Terriglobia bacterium]